MSLSPSTTKTTPHCQMLVIHPVFYFLFYVLRRDPQGGLRSDKFLNRTVLCELVDDFVSSNRVIRNDCLGFNNLSYTIHLRQEYIVAPMDQEILKVFFYDVRCAVVMHFSAWSTVY